MNLINVDTLREIKNSIAKFISIILIVGLGVFILTGLISSGEVMRNTMDVNALSQNYPHITISSPVAFDELDKEIINSQKNIDELEYGYELDLGVEGSSSIIKLLNMPYKVDLPILISGDYPKNEREILLDENLIDQGYKIGDTLTFKKEVDKFALEDKDKKDALKNYTFKVVGFCRSLDYISTVSRGYSIKGLGEITGFAYVSADLFEIEPSIARIVYEDLKNINLSSNEFKDKVISYKNKLEIDLGNRPKAQYDEIKSEITNKIAEGEGEISKAENELEDAENKIQDGKEKLNSGYSKYNSSKKEFENKTSSAKKELDNANIKLKSSENEIDSAEKKLQEGLDELKDSKKKLEDSKKKLDTGDVEYAQGMSEFERGVGELSQSKITLENAQEQLRLGRKKLDEGWLEINSGIEKLNAAKSKIQSSETQLKDAEAKYNSGLEQLASQMNMNGSSLLEINNKIIELSTQLQSAQELQSSLIAVQSGIAKIEAGIDTANQKKSELLASKTQIETTIASLGSTPEEVAKKEELSQQLIAINQGVSKIDGEVVGLNEQLKSLKSKEDFIKDAISKSSSMGDINALKEKLQQASNAVVQLQSAKSKIDSGKIELEAGKKQIADSEQQIQQAIEKAEAGEREYEENLAKFTDGKIKYENGKAKLEEAKKKLADSRIELDEGREKYEDGLKKYEEGYSKYLKSQGDLDVGKTKYLNGKEQYEKGLETYKEQYIKGASELRKASAKLYKSKQDLKNAEEEFKEKSEDAQVEIEQAKEKLSDSKKMLTVLKIPKYHITPSIHNGAINTYIDYAKRVDLLSLIFPVFFFLIAMLVSFTTMTRMVEEQRIIIGTYKALGYNKKQISNKFFMYGGLASLIGGIIGALAGSYILPMIISNAYSGNTIFENNLVFEYYPLRMIFAIVVGILFSAFSAKLAVGKTLKENAAQLLRRKAPSGGNRIFLENVSYIWERLSFLQKVTARNIFRYKNRMIMTIIGITGCTALLILGFGLKGSVGAIEKIQFEELIKYDMAVTYDNIIDAKAYNEYRQLIDSKNLDYLKSYQENVTFKNKGMDNSVSIVVPSENEFESYYELRDRATKEKINLSQDGIIISEKLSKVLGLKVGDIFEFEDSEGKYYKAEVSGITEMYMGHYIFMNKNYYTKVFGEEYSPNTDLIHIDNDKIEKLSIEVSQNKSVLSVFKTSTLKTIMNQFMGSISKVEVIITIASTMLALVVLYNLTNINIEERKREISTIKVLGFYPKETTSYIYRETAILTIMGILLGLIVGKILHYNVLQVVVPDVAMLDPTLVMRSYFIASTITLIISLIIMMIFHKKLQKIDMVESLKGNE